MLMKGMAKPGDESVPSQGRTDDIELHGMPDNMLVSRVGHEKA